MFGSFLPSLRSSSNHSLLGSRSRHCYAIKCLLRARNGFVGSEDGFWVDCRQSGSNPAHPSRGPLARASVASSCVRSLILTDERSLRFQLWQDSVSVHPKMERRRSSLASIPPLGRDFQGIDSTIRRSPGTVAFPRARFRFGRQDHCSSTMPIRLNFGLARDSGSIGGRSRRNRFVAPF